MLPSRNLVLFQVTHSKFGTINFKATYVFFSDDTSRVVNILDIFVIIKLRFSFHIQPSWLKMFTGCGRFLVDVSRYSGAFRKLLPAKVLVEQSLHNEKPEVKAVVYWKVIDNNNINIM